jgi:hypothetical protein
MRTWKKNNRNIFTALALAALAIAVSMTAIADEKAVNHDDGAGKSEGAHQLAPLDKLVGEWTIEAAWADGSPLKGRNVYAWADGGKVIKASTYVNGADGAEYCRYESFIAWDPEAGKPILLGFAYDGSIYEAHAIIEGETGQRIRYEYTERYGNKRTNIDQYNEFVDDDTLHWVVKVKQGEEWRQVMDVNWIRKK